MELEFVDDHVDPAQPKTANLELERRRLLVELAAFVGISMTPKTAGDDGEVSEGPWKGCQICSEQHLADPRSLFPRQRSCMLCCCYIKLRELLSSLSHSIRSLRFGVYCRLVLLPITSWHMSVSGFGVCQCHRVLRCCQWRPMEAEEFGSPFQPRRTTSREGERLLA